MSDPLILRARATAPIADVRRALTDPPALQTWLAEHVDVDLPSRFAFWGRSTPEGDAPHQRVLHADDDTLRFAWLLDGEETTTEIRLEQESAGSTVIALSQSHFDFQEALSGTTIRGVLQTFWALAMANLVDHVEGRAVTATPDFTSSEMREELLIDASPQAVFDSLIDSEKVSAWFGYPIGIEPWVGGRFAMGGFDAAGTPAKIVELVPGRRMATDWGSTGIASWELEGSGGKTRMTVVQSGFDGDRPPHAGWMGWLAGLSQLRRYHEVDPWRPIWVTADLPEGSTVAG